MTPAHFAALYPDPPVVPASSNSNPSSALASPRAISPPPSAPPNALRTQIRNFLNARLVLQSKQLSASVAARLCDQDDGPTAIGYGGARGGGKSFWLLAQMGADDCQRYPGLKCLLLRKVGKSNLEHFDLTSSTIPPARKMSSKSIVTTVPAEMTPPTPCATAFPPASA